MLTWEHWLIFWKNGYCSNQLSNVMKMLKNFNNHIFRCQYQQGFLEIYQHLYTEFIATKIFKKQLSTVSMILKAWYSKYDWYLNLPAFHTWNLHVFHCRAALCDKWSSFFEKTTQIFPLTAYTSETLDYFKYSALKMTAFLTVDT